VEHLWNPQRVTDFREAVRQNDYARFHRYTDDIDGDSHVTLRSQLEFKLVRGAEPANQDVVRSAAGPHCGGAH
jgi:glutamate synthase domain-containing protein 2